MSPAATRPTLDQIRSQFPALASSTVFFENAGGSQVPQVVADAIRDYLLDSYVNLGAGYAESRRATQTVDEAHDFVNLFMNGTDTGKVILGSSSSGLIRMLADCYAEVLQPGDEIVIGQSGHEANIGPWVRLERMGVRVRFWNLDRNTQSQPICELEELLDERTKIVAFVHVSNLLGEVVDVADIARRAHHVGARVVVDGVAYAPHHAIDVAAWDVDWYVYSTYKVFGPHMAALYGRADAIAELTGPNHFFIPRDYVPGKFELGCLSHEGCAGLLALGGYLSFLAGTPGEPVTRSTVTDAFEVASSLELALQARLIDYLRSKPGIRIVGPAHGGPSRVPTISFVHQRVPPDEISAACDAAGIGLRHGHMYAYRLCEALGIAPDPGVLRVSMVHYNTLDEVDRLIEVLDGVLTEP